MAKQPSRRERRIVRRAVVIQPQASPRGGGRGLSGPLIAPEQLRVRGGLPPLVQVRVPLNWAVRRTKVALYLAWFSWHWNGTLSKSLLYGPGAFLQVRRRAEAIAQRPAVKRGRMVNRTWGQPASQLHERHDASDFDTKTQDKLGALG